MTRVTKGTIMRLTAGVFGVIALMAGCVPLLEPPPPRTAPPVSARLSAEAAVANFEAVVQQVEPVAIAVCRERTPDQNCEFAIYIDQSQQSGVNAFYTMDPSGRPAIIFTVGLIAEVRNMDELAFVMGHEAGHHIGRHLPQVRASANVGAQIFAELARAGGVGDRFVTEAAQIGAVVASRQFTRQAELEADAIGTAIALRAGYDPLRGAEFFERIPEPARNFLASHPPNGLRIETVRRTMEELGRPGA
jgi:predicted Zn-dependent protease